MSKFVVSTKKSLFKPIEIEVDGKAYLINNVSPEMFEEARKQEDEALEGKTDALISQLVILTGISRDVVMKLDIRDITEMLKFISEQIQNPEKAGEPKGKNEPKPEDNK